MKFFLIKIVLLSLPLLLLFIFLEISIRFIPNTYSYKNKYINDSGSKIETLILGSSHTYYGINPEYLKLNSFNLANISQSLYFDNLLFKKYLKKMPNLQNIIIPVSYSSLSKVLDTGEESWRKYDYQSYMNCMPDIIDKSHLKSHSILYAKGVKKCLTATVEYLTLNKSPINCNSTGWGTNYTHSTIRDLEVTGKKASERHENGSSDFTANLQKIKEIIKISESHGIKIFILITPTYISYRKNLNTIKTNSIIKNCTILSDYYSNVFFLNHFEDKSFVKKDFYDADHLNDVGAEKFSKILNREIIELTNSFYTLNKK